MFVTFFREVQQKTLRNWNMEILTSRERAAAKTFFTAEKGFFKQNKPSGHARIIAPQTGHNSNHLLAQLRS